MVKEHLPAWAEWDRRIVVRVSNAMKTVFALDIVCFIFFININKFDSNSDIRRNMRLRFPTHAVSFNFLILDWQWNII